jgi:hypothetical protein
VTDPNCKVRRIREWYRVDCKSGFVSLVGGSREGVEFGGATGGGESVAMDLVASSYCELLCRGV